MAWYDHFSDGAIHRAWSYSGDVTETTHLKGVCTYDKAVYGDDAPDASVADITLSRASIPSTYGTHKVRFRCGSEEGNSVTPFGLYNYIGYTDPVHGYNNFMFVLVQGVRACGMRFIVRALNTDFKWVAYDFVTGKWNEIPPRTVDNYSAAVEDGEWVDLECTMSKDSIRIKMLPTDGTGPLNVDVTIPKAMLYRAYDNSAGPTFPKNYISAYAWTHDAWFEWDYYSEDIEWPEDLATTSSTELYTTVTAPPMLNVGRAPIPDGDTYIGRRGATGVDCREYLNRRTDFNDYFIKKAIKARGWRKITDLALRVQTIEQYVRDHINYAYDSAVYGVAEFFQYPKETWDLRQGDCVSVHEEIYTVSGLKKVGTLEEGELVLSYDFESKTFCYKPITKIWEKGVLPCKRVYLRNGQWIDVTENAPMWVRKNQTGDSVYEKRYLSDVDLERWWKCKTPCAKHIPYQVEDVEWLTEDLCFVLGHYLAEGWSEPSKVSTSGYEIDEYVLPRLLEAHIPHTRYVNNSGVPCVRMLKSEFSGLLRRQKDNSFDIHVEEWVFHLPPAKLSAILRGYWVGDGHESQGRLIYSTSSELWARDIQRIAMQLGRPMYSWLQENHGGAGTRPIWRLYENNNSAIFRDHGYPGLGEVSIKEIVDLSPVEMRDFQVADTHSFVFKNGTIGHNCEDWALIIKHFCDMAGVPEARVIINCGYVQSSQVAGGHSYCLYHRDDGTWTYLDPLCQGYGSSDVPINERPEFGNSPLYREVWWAFDRKKTYKFPDPGAFAYSAHIEHSLVCSCKLWEADVAVGLTGLNRLFIALEFTSKNALYMENSLAVRYGMCSVLYGSLEAKNNLTTRLLFALTVPVAILSRNPVSACLVARNTAGSTALVGATQYTIHLDGADITDKVEELSLELSEGNYTNTVSLTVVDPVLFDACKPDGSGRDRIVVTVDDDVFTFMLEDREDNLSFADFGLTVWGRSRTARLDKPYAVTYDEDYGFGGTLPEEESVTASSIIQALCSDCSVPVSVLDFTDYRISKGELAVGGRTPKQIIEDLAAASGCVLRSSKTGGLVLRRIRTTPSGAAVRLTDMDDVLEVSSSYEPPKGDNAVTVRGKQNRLEVAIEVDDGDNADRTSLVYYGDGRANTPVKLRVYTSPIASGAYSLLATDGTLKYYGTVQRTVVDEVVDVTSEVCQTAYPIVSLVSVDSNGTGLTARKGDTALDGKEILTNYDDVSLDAGVILVTYTTVYDLYELVGADTKVVVVYAIINPGADERFKDVLLTVQREGSGDASVGEFISNDLIVSEYQARVVAEAALEGWYYGKTVRRIDSVYKSVVDGGGVVLDVPSLGAVRAYKATDVTVKVERPVVSMSLVVEGDYVAPN